MQAVEALRQVDWIIVSTAVLLVLVGLAMLVSATYLERPLSGVFIRQAIAAGLGLGLCLFLSTIPYHVVGRSTTLLYVLGVAGLIFVAVTGEVIRGTISRLSFFGFQLQPSEFMKIGLILAQAAWLVRWPSLSWRGLLAGVALVAVPVVLIGLEPDLGVAALFILLWGALLFFWGLRWRMLIVLSLLAALATGAAWQWLLLDYQKDRLLIFLDPAADPRGGGYNVAQSIVALGSGKFLGRGLGHGPQSQLKFLPERHTDFIFASIGEELGFVGAGIVVVLYGVLLWRILKVAASTEDPFGQVVVVSTFFLLLFSFLVSAGMNIGLLPVTGIPLPLVSYGGSSLVTTWILLGLVQSVRVYGRFRQRPPLEIDQF